MCVHFWEAFYTAHAQWVGGILITNVGGKPTCSYIKSLAFKAWSTARRNLTPQNLRKCFKLRLYYALCWLCPVHFPTIMEGLMMAPAGPGLRMARLRNIMPPNMAGAGLRMARHRTIMPPKLSLTHGAGLSRIMSWQAR